MKQIRNTQAMRCGYAIVALVIFLSVMSQAAAPPAADRIADNLYGTSFVNRDDGWVVGAFGTIFRTRDGGKTWQPQVSHLQVPLFGVRFVNTDDGWAVGRSGAILHTSNGGDTWAAQDSGVEQHLFSVDFVDVKVGCAVGDWGTIVITKDGGETWRSRRLARDVILNSVSLVDREHAWAVGEAGAILATADRGETWTEQTSGVEKTLFGVTFVDLQRGWAVGSDGLILHTEDGGATWQVQNGAVAVDTLEQVGFAETYDNPTLYAVSVVNGFGVAVGDVGGIFVSTDGGHKWQRHPVPQDWAVSWLGGLSIVSGTHGIIVGASGRRLTIADGHIDLPGENSHAAQAIH